MFVLAHLSDPHLASMPRPRLLELAGKRGLGLVNWHLRRRHEHRLDVLEPLVLDLLAQAPDHIAVTGDLVNVALADEFAGGRAFLASLGPPDRVSFVPGNHDAYVRTTVTHAYDHWREYMSGDTTAAPKGEPASFPYVRRRGPLAIVGLSTAAPSGPFMATGRVGPDQLRRLEHKLAGLGPERPFKVVLLHHPPVSLRGDRLKRLIDAAAFRDVLARHQVDLVLHGHIHVNTLAWLVGPVRPVPSVSASSASATVHGEEPASYNLFRIEQVGGEWRCEMMVRGYGRDGGGIDELRRRTLMPPDMVQ